MRVVRSGLWAPAKAILKSSLQFKKLAIGLLQEVTTWDLVVWMGVLDVVGKTTSSPSSEGAFRACQRFGMPEHMVIQVVPLVKRRTAAFLLTDPGPFTGRSPYLCHPGCFARCWCEDIAVPDNVSN